MRVMTTVMGIVMGMLFASLALPVVAQEYGAPDRDNPGDRMIQEYLARETEKIHQRFSEDIESPERWQELRPQYVEEYFHMMGLWPLPEKTPLQATVTGTLEGDGFVVDMLHYQSMPGLYVTANLYRPANVEPDERLPAVLYVCGHSMRGRDGNKTAYQSHGIWFARHGYVCLIVDTLQMGEIAAIHHGTYREQRWWWHSRGYTSAGVECWNGVRGIDYLQSRDDVDPQRIAVTGISGGGVTTFWVAAADQRVQAAVPVSGMSDLISQVTHRVINGHCDCMFPYNTFQWSFARFGALIAPRPMLFVNSDNDPIFPMDGNERYLNRLEQYYSLYGAGDQVVGMVSIGGHAYRQDIRQAAYRFINTHLKNDPSPVTDSEVDLVTGGQSDQHPIPPSDLRVFPTDDDLPADQLNTTIDEHFVPQQRPSVPDNDAFEPWRADVLKQLRRVTFGVFPDRIPPAEVIDENEETRQVETESGIRVPLITVEAAAEPQRILLVVATEEQPDEVPAWAAELQQSGDAVYLLQPRGIGATRWTRRNPPNYVERSHALLGRTVDTGRVWDVIAAARLLHQQHRGRAEIQLLGQQQAAVWAAYAALWEPDITAVTAHQPFETHMDSEAPQFLNILRVADVPDVFGLLAPRPLHLTVDDTEPWEKTARIYQAAGAAEQLRIQGPTDSPP